jgi:purine-binding chemotaxis protein CheW
MKNVIIFAVDSECYAVELRWVREIITLGHVTRVPGAPVHMAGAINMRGVIIPVLDVSVLPGEAHGQADPRRRTSGEGDAIRSGDGAVLIDVEGVAMALRMSKVEEVSTVTRSPRHQPGSVRQAVLAGAVLSSRGREVALLDPPELVRLTLAMAQSKRELSDLPGEPDTLPAVPRMQPELAPEQ